MSNPTERQPLPFFTVLDDAPNPVRKRGLDTDTVRRFGVGTAYDDKHRTMVLVFPYRKDGVVVGQKAKTPDKEFMVRGNITDAELFGQHLCGSFGRLVVITEGELDAMAVDQAMQSPSGRRYGAVSIPNGAQAAAKAIKAHLEWLCTFETVVLCFDMDEPGRKAVDECKALFPPGKLAIAELPRKDACDMLENGEGQALASAIWNAKPYRPDGIITVGDIIDKVMTPPQRGLSWCLPTLDAPTYGRRYGECVALGAGTGVGKTTLMTQQIGHDLFVLNQSVGVFALEQAPDDTVRRVLGQYKGRTFHVPDSGWTDGELKDAVTDLIQNDGKLYLYDHFGLSDWDSIASRIRYLNKAHGVRLFYLDHLTALAAKDAANERTVLEQIMESISSLTKELDIWLLFVSHLSTPEHGAHEEGARVAIRHFKGSRMIGAWSHFMLALERDQQAEDATDRRMTTLRVLKDRFTGQSLGVTVPLSYDQTLGKLVEAQPTYTTGGFHDAELSGDEPF